VVDKTPAAARNAANRFRLDNSGTFRYDLNGASSGSLRIFDTRGRLIKSVPLSGAQTAVNTNMNVSSQMLFWKVDAGGKVLGQGRVNIKN
jgi:hypothetical protein